jgi:D-alanyl-D-alanine endopeptidase (penicillin-binding protein 7)
MSKRIFDFVSSVGIMLLGLLVLVMGTVFFQKIRNHYPFFIFPSSAERSVSFGKSAEANYLPASLPSLPVLQNKAIFNGVLSASSIMVVDDASEKVLFEKNSSTTRPLASITKLMSALVLAEQQINFSTTTTILRKDISEDVRYVKVGDEFKLEDLWQIGLIGSSNTAINTLVRNSSSSAENFVALMNEKAQKLNLKTLYFVEPTGLDYRNIGSPSDILGLLKIALQNKKISSTLHTGVYEAHPIGKKVREVMSTDWLLTKWVPHNFPKDQVVGKTGYIKDSGYNFVAKITDTKKHTIRVVVLGANSNESRFSEARDVAEWVFANYVWPDEKNYSSK